MTKGKKLTIVSLILALFMLFSVCSTAFAAAETGEIQPEPNNTTFTDTNSGASSEGDANGETGEGNSSKNVVDGKTKSVSSSGNDTDVGSKGGGGSKDDADGENEDENPSEQTIMLTTLESDTAESPVTTATHSLSSQLPTAGKWDLSKSKEATNLDGNFESNVTLSLPAGDYKGDLDVVFVLDGSTSTDKDDLAGSAAGLLEELAGFLNLNVKAGLVIFGGSVPILYKNDELLSLAEEGNLGKINEEITNTKYDGETGRSGSNLQAGVIAGQKLLNADSAVADSDKYLILLTDGGARMWVNETGKAMSQGFRLNNAQGVSWGDNQDFASRYIEAGESAMPLRIFDEVWNAGGTDESFAQYAMTQAEAAETNAWKNAANWETVCKDQDAVYYTSLEVSTYYAATSIIEASQNSHVIWVDYAYHDGKYAEYTNSFKSWLADKGYTTRYDSSKLEPAQIFGAVKDQLIYLLDAGSTVVDYMGYVEGDYNLDFINKAETLTLTVGGEKKDVVDLGNNTYGFGKVLDSEKYEYELTYYPANDGEEHFVWTINVPVTKDKPVKLTYKVKLVNPKSAPGTYGVYDKYGENNDGSDKYSLYTNNKATLTPVDSNGKQGVSEDFKKPTVSYVVESTPTPTPTPTPAPTVTPTPTATPTATPVATAKPSIPQTSDSFPVEGILILMVVGAVGTGAAGYLRKKHH